MTRGLKPGDEFYEEQRFALNEWFKTLSATHLINIINNLLDITDEVNDDSYTCDEKELQELIATGNGENNE